MLDVDDVGNPLRFLVGHLECDRSGTSQTSRICRRRWAGCANSVEPSAFVVRGLEAHTDLPRTDGLP